MLNTIVTQINDELKKCGVSEVYSAFDNISTEKKGKGIYTVTSIDSFESSAPIYSSYHIYFPFKSYADIRVTAPLDYSMAELYSYFDTMILPALNNLGSLNCSLKNLTMKKDSNINRLVLRICFSVSGITRLERSSS